MNWTHVLLAGFTAAVFSTIVGLMRKKNWIGRGGGMVLILVAIAIWNIADRYYLNNLTAKNYAEKIDEAIENMPIYKVIKEQDPQLFTSVRTQMLAMRKEGKSEQQFIDAIQPLILAIQRRKLQSAPDDQVVAVMKANMKQVAEVQKISDDACYRFIFPEVKGGINPTKILSREMLMERINTDAMMMRSAYGPGKHSVTDQERQNALSTIQSVAQQLLPKYGQDFTIMSDPLKGLGKEKIACELVQDVWNTLMQLPEDKAAGAIRRILADESQ